MLEDTFFNMARKKVTARTPDSYEVVGAYLYQNSSGNRVKTGGGTGLYISKPFPPFSTPALHFLLLGPTS